MLIQGCEVLFSAPPFSSVFLWLQFFHFPCFRCLLRFCGCSSLICPHIFTLFNSRKFLKNSGSFYHGNLPLPKGPALTRHQVKGGFRYSDFGFYLIPNSAANDSKLSLSNDLPLDLVLSNKASANFQKPSLPPISAAHSEASASNLAIGCIASNGKCL